MINRGGEIVAETFEEKMSLRWKFNCTRGSGREQARIGWMGGE